MVSNDIDKIIPARGVKFYFLINQNIPEKERNSWQETISRSSPLSKWFRRVQFEYSDHPALISDWQGWNLIKIFCPDAHISMKPAEAKSCYKEMFVQFSEWFIKICGDRRIECKPYDFRVLFRLCPPENPGEFVPIPSLSDISRKVVSPPTNLPDPPTTPEALFDLAQKIIPGKAFEELLKYSEKSKIKVYGGYGLRTEEHANTYEIDTVLPDQSDEIELIRGLKGELSHELILQSQEKAPTDFNKVVNLLLTILLQNGVIDSKKIGHIYANPSDYVDVIQLRKRFILKFDLKKWGPASELLKALDIVKKQIQKELAGTTYYLYGAVSYKLTDEDLTKMEAVIENIIYFRNSEHDDLFTNMSIFLVDSTYERIVEIARKTDEILRSSKIIDFDELPSAATNIEDAKKRWNSAASDLIRDGRNITSFMFYREISGVPLEVFTNAQEALFKEFNKIAREAHFNVTLTTDNQNSVAYGCYVVGPKS
jgi:hypothetical protein